MAGGEVSGKIKSAPGTDELARLQAELMIPVPGIAPGALVDSYNDARSGGRAHHALDIMAPRWTPVLSAADGRVLKLHSSVAGGLMVYAAEPMERFVSMYGHLQEYARGLTEGAPLKRGDTLGFVGTTGNAAANAPHLHFAIARTDDVNQWWTGTPLDPRPLLQR
jgi:murein DD-endopeptidase MepM/ murein hydrolase activator NlpD